MRRFTLALLLLLGSAAAARATVIVPYEFRELVAAAPVIVHGHVVDVRAQWVDGRRAVETVVTVEAEDYLKGDLGEEITFKVPGGQIGRYRTVFVGAPTFGEGDEVVLFLTSSAPSTPHIVGLSQGVFRVVTDATSGRRVVTPPAILATAGVESQRIVRGDPARRPVPIETFRQVVRQVLLDAGGVR